MNDRGKNFPSPFPVFPALYATWGNWAAIMAPVRSWVNQPRDIHRCVQWKWAGTPNVPASLPYRVSAFPALRFWESFTQTIGAGRDQVVI